MPWFEINMLPVQVEKNAMTPSHSVIEIKMRGSLPEQLFIFTVAFSSMAEIFTGQLNKN